MNKNEDALGRARAALEAGRFARAWAALRRPVPALERPQADYLKAEVLRGQGYFAQAAVLYGGVLKKVAPLEDPVLYVETALSLCGTLHSLGRIAEARRALAGAASAARRLGLKDFDRPIRLEGLMLERAAGDYPKAVAGLRSEFKRTRDLREQGYLLWALGGALRFSGRLAESQRAFEDSRRRYLRSGDALGAGYAECGLGGVSRIRGRHPEARSHYARALAFFERTEDVFGAAYGHCGLANVLRQLGDWRGAEAHYLKAHRLYSGLGDVPDLGYVEWGLAKVMEKTGRLPEARRRLRRALPMFASHGEKRGEALTLLAQAQVEHALGRSAAAEALFDRAVATARRAGLKAHLEAYT